MLYKRVLSLLLCVCVGASYAMQPGTVAAENGAAPVQPVIVPANVPAQDSSAVARVVTPEKGSAPVVVVVHHPVASETSAVVKKSFMSQVCSGVQRGSSRVVNFLCPLAQRYPVTTMAMLLGGTAGSYFALKSLYRAVSAKFSAKTSLALQKDLVARLTIAQERLRSAQEALDTSKTLEATLQKEREAEARRAEDAATLARRQLAEASRPVAALEPSSQPASS